MSAPLVVGVVCARPGCGHGADLHDGICFGTACECVRFVGSAAALPVPVGPVPQALPLSGPVCSQAEARAAGLDIAPSVEELDAMAESIVALGDPLSAEVSLAQSVPLLGAAVTGLRARVAELEAERAKYVGKEPTIAEEMAYLSRCVNAVDAFCHEMSRQGIVSGGPFTVAAVRRLIEGGGLSAGGLFLADVDGGDPTLWRSEEAAQKHCVAVLGSELEGRAYDWAPVEGGVSQVRFVDEPGWGAARVWPLTVSSAADEDECTCPETDRVEPHWSGCPLEDAPCPVDGPIPGVGTGAGAPEMRALRAALYGPPDGEHYAQVHHAYLLGHDLPETGGLSVRTAREDDDPARCLKVHPFSPRDGWRMVCGNCDHGKDADCHQVGA